MTNANDLRTLYGYNNWANEKLLAVVSHLSPEEFTQPVSGSYGSVATPSSTFSAPNGAGSTAAAATPAAPPSNPPTTPI